MSRAAETAPAAPVVAAPADGILTSCDRPRALLVLAPGAGASVTSPFYEGFADALAEVDVATLRFDFPYRRAGRPFPDREPVLRDAWRRAFDSGRDWAGPRGLPVAVGGRSMGGRIASLCVADGMAADALVLLAYPLHPPGRPERPRDAHLSDVRIPVLWMQGDRDPFATPDLLSTAVAKVAGPTTYVPIVGGDHGFRVRGERIDDAERGRRAAISVAGFLDGLRRVA